MTHKVLLRFFKRLPNIGILFLITGCFFSITTQAQQTAKMTPNGVGYLEHLPADYASNSAKKYPLLIFLHGLGETGNGSSGDLQKVKANGPPRLIESGQKMCFTVNGVEECFIVISPQLSSSAGGWWPNILQPFFDYILNGAQNYRIDKTKVYLTGLSLGGQGVYIGLGETTDVFAAGAVIAGFGNGNGCTISARKIPVWGFHGDSDGTIKYSDGLTEFSRIGWCTSPSPVGELKWTSYPGVGHNAWDRAYTTDHSVQSPMNVYEWLLTKSKNAPANNPPVANAGADKTITLPTSSIVLAGTGTDTDGSVSSYSWAKISGGAATLANANTATVSLAGLMAGSYVFRLTVVDNKGASASDDVTVVVNAALNVAPIANAGPDRTVSLPLSLLIVNGSATDSDGTIASYAWTKVSGGTVTLANINAATVSLTGLLSGSYVFRLTVTDDTGATATDDVTIVVNGLLNSPPSVNAGSDQTITLPTNSASLSGTASDRDGSISSYTWTKVSGGAATLNNANTATLNVSGMTSGPYTFRLAVTDNSGAVSTDEMLVNVNAAPSVGTNQALLKAVVASSDETGANVSSLVVDGNGSTRWSSKYSDPQWIYVDLGSVVNISRVKLTWEQAMASSYRIQVSNDASNWSDIKSVTGNTSYINDLTGLSGSGRYVRMYGITRTTQYGYSLYEFEVYGNGGGVAPTANAGVDKTTTLPTNTLTLTGSGVDSDGSISSYTWTNISGAAVTLSNANTATLNIAGLTTGQYVFRLTVTDNSGMTAQDDVNVTVNAASSAKGVNLALLKTTVTSSDEGWANTGAQSVDGNATTRWSSKFSDPQWIYVDLGSIFNITRVYLTWEQASASSYKIQVSNDAVNWTDIKSVTGNASLMNDLTGLAGSGRYVRMYGIARNTQYGYSLYEFEVYGEPAAAARLSVSEEQQVSGSSEKMQSLEFFNKNYEGGKDYSVVVYDGSGKRIYNGKWSKELFPEVFEQDGIYFYHIVSSGKEIDNGKLYIKR